MPDNESLSENLNLRKPERGSFEGVWDVPANENIDKIDALFSASAVAGGHEHTGQPGQGPQIQHANLGGVGTNTHAQIDSHIANTTLHTDVAVGTITGEELNNSAVTVTASNVTTINFQNAALVNTAPGVVTVIPRGSSGTTGGSALFSKPESASVGYTDNFTQLVGTLLNQHSWVTWLSSINAHSDWTIGGAQSQYAFLRNDNAGGSILQQGYSTAHCRGHIPHGTAQRITLYVDNFRPIQQNGAAVTGTDALNAITSGDRVCLSLDLLSGVGPGGNLSRPTAQGLSFLLYNTGGTISAVLSIKVAPTAQEVTWTDFSTSELATALTSEYLEGWHELSLRRHPTIPDAFYIHYYRNEGLVWTKLFNIASTIQAEADFAQAIVNLVNNLIASSQPSYGRIGFAVSYNLSDSTRLYEFRVKHVAIGSADDDSNVGVVTIPTPDVVQPPEPVCPSGPFGPEPGGLGYLPLEIFPLDPDAPGTVWTIRDAFDAPFGGVRNGDGFIVQATSGVNTVDYNIFCGIPSPIVPPDNYLIYEGQQGTSLTIATADGPSVGLYGKNLPRATPEALLANTLIYPTTNIPVNYDTTGTISAQLYSTVDPLPQSSLLFNIASVDGEDTTLTTSGYSEYKLTYNTGPRIPWGAQFRIEMTAPYEDTYVSSWSNIEVGIPQANVVAYSLVKYHSVLNEWVTVEKGVPAYFSGSSTTGGLILEGEHLAVVMVIDGFPYGPRFWDAGNGFVKGTGEQWSSLDTRGVDVDYDPPPILDLVPRLGLNTSTSGTDLNNNTLFVTRADAVVPGTLAQGSAVFENTTIPPQNTYITTVSELPYQLVTDPALLNQWPNASSWFVHTRLRYGAVSALISEDAVGALTYATTPPIRSLIATLPAGASNPIVLDQGQIIPNNPVVVASSITTTTAGASATIVIDVRGHHDRCLSKDGSFDDDDMSVTAVSGITIGTITKTFVLPNGTVTATPATGTNGLAKIRDSLRRFTITGTLAGSPTAIVLRLTKQAAKAWISSQGAALSTALTDAGYTGITGEVDYQVGTVSGVATIIHDGITKPDGSPTPVIQEQNANNRFHMFIRNHIWNGAANGTTIVQGVPTVINGVGYTLSDILSSDAGVAITFQEMRKIASGVGTGGLYEEWLVRVGCPDPGDEIPATITAVVISVRNPNGTPTALPSISITAQAQPAITAAGLLGDDGISPLDTWDISDPATKTLFVTATGVATRLSDGLVIDDIFVESDGAHAPLVPVEGEQWMTHPTLANTYICEYQRGDDISDIATTYADGSTFTLTITKRVIAGTPNTDSEAGFITMTAAQAAGPSWQNNTSAFLQSYAPETPSAMTAAARSTTRKVPSGREVFVTTPQSNEYFEFILPGQFRVSLPLDLNSNFEVDFLDSADVSILDPDFNDGLAFITAANRNQLTGYGRTNTSSAGKLIKIKVTNLVTTEVTFYRTGVAVLPPRIPSVRYVVADVVEGTTNNLIKIYGSNFLAKPAPAGAPDIFRSDNLDNDPSGILTNIVGVSKADDLIIYSVDIAASSAGGTIGFEMSYNGGERAIFPGLIIVQEAAAATPQVDELLFYSAADQNIVDSGGTPSAPVVGPTSTARLRITGTGLNSRSVSAAYLVICGEANLDSNPNRRESLPGQALHPSYKLGASHKIYQTSVITQTETELVVNFPAPVTLANARCRLYLERPASHPLLAGTWTSSAIDSTGITSSQGGLTNYGLTVQYGSYPYAPYLNRDTSVSANTVLATARAAQTAVGLGSSALVVVRFTTAFASGRIPQIIAVPDPTYGSSFTIDSVVLRSNKLELEVQLSLPQAGITDTYPLSAYDPDQYVAACGLALANGTPIFSVILGAADWGATTGQIAF